MLSTALVVVGTLAIPFMVIGFLTMARFLRTAMPRIGLVADRSAAAAALQAIENSPVILAVFLAPFFVGCVLGLATLALGLRRSGVLPRWVPVALLAFLMIDFGTGPVGPDDPHWLFLAAAIGVAHRVLKSSDAEWAYAAKGGAR